MFAQYLWGRRGTASNELVEVRARSNRATWSGRLTPVAFALARLYSTWARRARERSELAHLSDQELRDVSITRCDARFETNKPFWKP